MAGCRLSSIKEAEIAIFLREVKYHCPKRKPHLKLYIGAASLLDTHPWLGRNCNLQPSQPCWEER
uniref:Uncharacterized protein n=1 Tax=Hyaloperonospora arabidopsidis (strain Emoy2) TaxID=559515 RepID=M4BAJ4_HYAAE